LTTDATRHTAGTQLRQRAVGELVDALVDVPAAGVDVAQANRQGTGGAGVQAIPVVVEQPVGVPTDRQFGQRLGPGQRAEVRGDIGSVVQLEAIRSGVEDTAAAATAPATTAPATRSNDLRDEEVLAAAPAVLEGA